MILRLLNKARALLNVPTRLEIELRRLQHQFDAGIRDIEEALKQQRQWSRQTSRKQAAQCADLERELSSTRKELRERLLQYHLQLGRLANLLEGRSVPLETYSPPIPLVVDSPASPQKISAADDWLHIDHCPGCRTTERTVVCEWNKIILREKQPDDASAVYNYALCHGCGIVYATRRPIGARYRSLAADFPEAVGRDPNNSVGLLYPYPLSDVDRERYRQLIAAGVFVSDHNPREHLAGVFKDRLESAAHVEILGSLLDLAGARVLEVRSRAGSIVEGLRRHYAASVAAMPIFESQQFILRELYGIECSDLIDFDLFTIPFEGAFDLIVCNHMCTHAARPERFFDQIRGHLRAGSHLYLYNEVDEAEFLTTGKSILSAFNPLHLQAFDQSSLIRVLNANGFDVVFIKSRNGNQLCLARFTGRREWSVPDADELNRRIFAYSRARARMILKAPEQLRSRFAELWPDTLEDAVSAGIARFDQKGILRLVKE